MLIKILAFAAGRGQQLATAALDELNRRLALAQADDVLDVPGPLLPALHRREQPKVLCCPAALITAEDELDYDAWDPDPDHSVY